ncbi:MAG: TIGR02646 family protein [Oscillospiraceae bacterium]|nr:TIGR02646 family protein [Oscillospiraceae bacterium]
MLPISTYGGYDKIPKVEKDGILAHYRHDDIRKALSESSFDKGAFCECKPSESGNIEIEHFAPKSKYPDLTFEWDNLLPSCRKCNEAKSDFDTILEPIINPANVDPETIFTYDFFKICPIKDIPVEEIASRTINVCNLNNSRLYGIRASLLISLTEYMDELKDKLEEIEDQVNSQKKGNKITKLRNSIEKVEQNLEASNCYAGYCRWFVSNNDTYLKAKKYLSDYME